MTHELHTEIAEIEGVVRAYFMDLFMIVRTKNLDYMLSGEEIVEALKEMGPKKASRANDFSMLFYQKFWHIVGKNTCLFYFNILNRGDSFEELNKINIVLILKISDLTSLKNFRHISLCMVIYKKIVKIVANRFKWYLTYALMKRKALLCRVLHAYKHKRTGINGFLSLKLDKSKAYDRVE
ncbi:reverse transcriptase [Gossypium australe]|uniref:Reverse transcriptase n=1 Tax=Gossypium australe TaxID=47621 RepID=A0A5B6W511_9ROSI|nr:reverse transcriptase [Gossypium australe]